MKDLFKCEIADLFSKDDLPKTPDNPQIAKQRATNWKAVERNIRSAIDIIWKRNPLGLQQLSSCQMDTKPATAQFISFLTFYLQFDES